MTPSRGKDPLTQTGKWRAVETEAERLECEAGKHREQIDHQLERIARHRAAYALSARRVLVVEDHEPYRRTLRNALRKFDVRLCASAEEALAELRSREREYDVVVTDLDMPGIDGEALVRLIREESLRPRGGIILISGLEGLEEVALRAGVDAHFVKPIDVGALQEKVEELVQRPSTPGEEPK